MSRYSRTDRAPAEAWADPLPMDNPSDVRMLCTAAEALTEYGVDVHTAGVPPFGRTFDLDGVHGGEPTYRRADVPTHRHDSARPVATVPDGNDEPGCAPAGAANRRQK